MAEQATPFTFDDKKMPGLICMLDKDGQTVAAFYPYKRQLWEFILRAVNMHDELIETLRCCLDPELPDCQCEMCVRIRAMLAKAEGK